MQIDTDAWEDRGRLNKMKRGKSRKSRGMEKGRVCYRAEAFLTHAPTCPLLYHVSFSSEREYLLAITFITVHDSLVEFLVEQSVLADSYLGVDSRLCVAW